MTAQTLPDTAAVDPTVAAPSLGRRLLRDPLGASALVFLLVVILAAAFAPLLTSHDPNTAVLQDVLARPGENGHLLGADRSGRDVWARLLYGSRFSLLGAALAVVVAVGIGAVSGLIAGYIGRWFDGVASWAASILMALPAMVVLLAARSVIGTSAWWAMAIFGVLLSASVFRLVRGTVQAVRGELYVDAARVAGLSDLRIIFRHVLRVVRAPVIIQVASIASVSIAIQAGLEFLGLGDMTIPTWGSMLNDGFAVIYQQPILLLWPSLVIALVCLALALVANSLRDALEGTGAARPKAPVRRAAVPGEAPAPVGAASLPADEEDVILRVQDLHIGYAQAAGTKEVVHGVSLDVRRGEVLGLIGESGSGKTQTAFGVLRLLPVGGGLTDGRVLWHGTDMATLDQRAMAKIRGRKIAYVPQEPMSNLDPTFTIGSQLVEPIRQHLGLSRTAARARALELLERVGIPDPVRTFRSYPHEVSGGMAQRVLIAGAISCEPELLIADEPTTALDVTVQADVLDLLRSLQADLGMGMILVTHNFGVVADLCDRVAVMQDGLIVEAGPVRDVFRDPQHPYTRLLFDAILTEDGIRDPFRPSETTETVTAPTTPAGTPPEEARR
ncbi:MAG TPA: dipeptide/oligopeptide/nickel ABC transporter permease/ATP-binding protein [Cellulomonas sp.]